MLNIYGTISGVDSEGITRCVEGLQHIEKVGAAEGSNKLEGSASGQGVVLVGALSIQATMKDNSVVDILLKKDANTGIDSTASAEDLKAALVAVFGDEVEVSVSGTAAAPEINISNMPYYITNFDLSGSTSGLLNVED